MQDENSAGTPVQDNGISLGDIFRTIAVRKWLALIIAAVITVAGTLAIYLGYNRMKQQYILEFSLVLPGIDINSAVYTYPDGKTLQYADIVSSETLTAVKLSEKKFSDINVKSIVTKGDISVIRTVSEKQDEVIYRLSVNADVFPSESLAADFLKAVVNVPREYVAQMNLDYDVYLSLSAQAEDYEGQLGLLVSQLDYLIKQYNSLIKTYGENVVANGKTLSSQLNEINSYKNKNTLGTLLSKVKNEGILKSEELVDKLALKKVDYQRQLDIAQATLDNLLKGSASGSGTVYLDANVIKEQSDLVETLKQQIADVDKYIASGKVDATFEQNYIKPQYEILQQLTEGLSRSVVEVYDKSSSVAYVNAGVIKTVGGYGLIVSVLLSLIVGVIVALIVAYFVGKHTLAKRRAASSGSVAVPQEQVLQAAVTEDEPDRKDNE